MASPEDLVSHHVTVLRRCGLSDEDICEVYGVSDPPDDVSVGRVVLESFDGEMTPRNLYDQTHRVLAAAPRGIDAPRDYPNRVVPQQLDTVMGAFGFSMYFLDGDGEPLASGAEPSQPFRIALEDPNGNVRTTTFEYPDTNLGEQNYPALVAAIQSELLDGVPLTFAMLSDWADDRWRFVLLESDRLDALESHYGDGIECFGEPLLHEHSPAEFASGLAVEEPAVEAGGGSGTTGDDGGDGDIGVDESTEGWLGSGGSDLSDVDLDGSGGDDDETDEPEDEVETGLEDIFSTIEEDATAGGDGGIEIESTGKSVEDLVADAGGAGSATGAAEADTEPEPAESAAESEPAESAAESEPAESTTEPAEADTEPVAADPVEPEAVDSQPAAESEQAADADPAPTADEPASPEPETADTGGFVAADPEPARTEESGDDEATADETVEAEPATEPGVADASEPADGDDAAATSASEQAEPVAADGATDDAAASADRPTSEPTVDAPAEEAEAARGGASEAGEPASGTAAAPVDEPVDAEPAEAEPVDAEPVDTEPVDAEPVDTEPVDTEPIDAEPEAATDATDEPAAEPTTGTGSDAEAEPAPSATASTAEADASETPTTGTTDDDDEESSPGIVGRIVGAIKGIF